MATLSGAAQAPPGWRRRRRRAAAEGRARPRGRSRARHPGGPDLPRRAPTAPGRRRRRRARPACASTRRAAARLCLTVARSGVDFRAVVLDGRMRTRHTLTLTGLPSRARVSPERPHRRDDDLRQRRLLHVARAVLDPHARSSTSPAAARSPTSRSSRSTKDGERIHSPDFNFWGVTFARDSDEFYATLATGAHHYLVHGSVRARAVEVIHDNVECPSLSPDGTRIAYKRRDGKPWHWRLHVLDLAHRRRRRGVRAPRRSTTRPSGWTTGTLLYGIGVDVWSGPGRRQRPPAALPGRRGLAVHAALRTSSCSHASNASYQPLVD